MAVTTELPDTFATQEDMDAVIGKVWGDMQAEKEAAALAERQENQDTAVTTAQDDTETQVTGDDASARNSAGEQTQVIEKKPAPPAEGQQSQTETTGSGWLDAELRDLAVTIGVPEATLAEFQSRDELERTLKILDAKALAAGRQQLSQAPGGQQQAGQNSAESKPAAPTPEPVKPLAKAESQPAWDSSKYLLADEYDDGVVKPHNEFVQAVDARIAMLEAKLAQAERSGQQQQAQGVIQQFESIVDQLGHPELFGMAGQRSTEQAANVAKVWDHHRAHVLGLISQGRQGRTDKAFVSRAAQAEFGEHFTKSAQQQVTRKLKEQSHRIMGGPAGKPVKPIAGAGGGSPAKDPGVMAELVAEFKKLESEG